VRAAANLIYTNGCTASSLAEIATAASVLVGNVYHYLTKEALAEAVVELRLEELRAVLPQAGPHDRPSKRIQHFLQFLTERVQSRPATDVRSALCASNWRSTIPG
jgi:AcrR family transcriptional regulator